MKNIEKIKAMSIDEMAEFIVKSHDYMGIMDQSCRQHCPNFVSEDCTCRSDNLASDCTKAMRIFLEQEAQG